MDKDEDDLMDTAELVQIFKSSLQSVFKDNPIFVTDVLTSLIKNLYEYDNTLLKKL